MAEEIINTIIENESLRFELASAPNEDAYIDIIVGIGSTIDEAITPETVRDYIAKIRAKELSDMELNAIAGGGCLTTGLTGEDTKEGTTGNDHIKVQIFDPYVDGGMGDDDLDGSPADDTMHGGEGDDDLWGGLGDDFMTGNEGDDSMRGHYGDDTMSGGEGNDTMYGNSGDDSLDGGDGDDKMWGGWGSDSMAGGSGADTMYGNLGRDSMDGGAGDDVIDGGWGSDTINGGEGNDILTGGLGADTFIFNANAGEDTITDFNLRRDTIQLEGVTSAEDFEVTYSEGNTIISYAGTTIIVEDTNLTAEQIMNMNR